jgi:starch phosphorylase
LGDGQEHGDDPAWDAVEASQLYHLLEGQVIPEFYARDRSGIPKAWVSRVRESMASLTPRYSANRSVREYVELCYLPAMALYQQRAQHGGALGVQIAAWWQALESGWPTLRFGNVSVDTQGDRHRFTAEVVLGVLQSESVCVELFADPVGDNRAFRQVMTRLDGGSAGSGVIRYFAAVPTNRAQGDYTVRIVPVHPGVRVPLEAPRILWSR